VLPKMVFEVSGWLADKHTFDKRKYNKMHKEKLKQLGYYWHGKFFKRHFTKEAYRRYGQDYHMRRKKGRGNPLVVKGHLRRRTRPSNAIKVSSTANKVTINIPYGNPKNKTAADLKKEIFITMKKRGVDYKTAQRMVSRANAYAPNVQAMFQSAMASIDKQEEEQLAKELVKWEEREIQKWTEAKRNRRKRL